METQFTDSEIDKYCLELANKIPADTYNGLYPVPMGGYPVAIRLSEILALPIVYTITSKTLIVDDLIDSGKTLSKFPGVGKAVLFVKNNKENEVDFYAKKLNDWIKFPWEKETNIQDHIVRMLEYIGEDPNREGLLETPKRVVKMWEEIFRGYDLTQKPKIQVFKNGSDGLVYDEMIIDTGKFYSHCEHHMVPFLGNYWFAYIPHPEGNIIGLSKVARIVDYNSAKLQIQERLVHDIVEDLWQALENPEPLGMALVMKAQHLCKTMRGVKKEGQMTTSKLKGVFKTSPVARDEFMRFVV